MRTILLSKRASRKLEDLFDYLESEWSQKVKSDFILRFDKSLKQIQKLPESCPQTRFAKGIRMLVITKQTSVFYRFDSRKIYFVSIFDNRMNPKKLKKELE
ncbi:hypothetical protein MASR2M47_45130 [Draconibacterium sp.]